MRKILNLLFVTFALISCSSPKVIVQENTRDVFHEIVRTDTLITMEADSASLTALLECDSMGNVILMELESEKGKRTLLEAQLKRTINDAGVKQMQLSIDCKADSLQLLVNRLRERITSRDSITTTITKQVRFIPPSYRFATYFFWLIVACKAVWLLWYGMDYIPACKSWKIALKLFFRKM